MKKDTIAQLELLLEEYDVSYSTFIQFISDYFSGDDLKGLLDHVAEELNIQ